jgi:hypothetical protein
MVAPYYSKNRGGGKPGWMVLSRAPIFLELGKGKLYDNYSFLSAEMNWKKGCDHEADTPE